MNSKQHKGLLKHWDFILIDLICLQVSFVFAYWLSTGYRNPYLDARYQLLLLVLTFSQLIIILFGANYRGILRRKKFDELFAVTRYMLEIVVIALMYLFVVQQSGVVSRLQIGFTAVFYIVLDYLFRLLNKRRLFHRGLTAKNRSIVLVTSSRFVPEAMARLTASDIYQDFFISGILLLDGDGKADEANYGVPVMRLSDAAIETFSHEWVDEFFLLQPEDLPFPSQLMDDLMGMGITVSFTMSALNDARWPVTDVRKIGSYKVLSSSVRFASAGQMALKRAMDILGGLVGCVLTGILFIFIAPMIYAKSPGPIFFSQTRVGANGRPITIYKFRSMYMDAEERKAALMEQNKVKSGMMFKMDDDPRIIGSEKKDKNGKPKGIGNFIRNTSIDEFPQFYCVLKGTMSLVGWRPATFDEWEKYDLKHRIRASMKPGITGMWQVSGRSEITDFEEVVRLDREYIENWSILLDIKILFKTVAAVVTRRGAE